MADTARPRLPPLQTSHARNVSTVTTDSDSSSSSPIETATDDDRAAFTIHVNDSQSTIGPLTFRRRYVDQNENMDLDMDHVYRTSPVQKLPAELLITIFSKLTTTRDLRNCMLVSYPWAVCAVNILWHRPLINNWENAMSVARTLAAPQQSFPYHDMVKRINMSAVYKQVNDVTMRCFFACKNVERLTLTSCTKITDLGIEGLIDGTKRLQALDVTDLEQCTDRSIITLAKNCPRLQGLNITNCSYVTDESVSEVAYGCRQLKRLKLNGVARISDDSILRVAKYCRSILEIDLQGCHAVGSASITAILVNMPQLRELRLAGCVGIDNRAFTDVPPHLRFEAMRVLDLTACDGLGDDAICRILPQAPRLRNLVLAKCRHITDVAVRAICTLTKNLHYIHLGHCGNLSDQAVIDLVHHCNRIRYIDLACCSRLTDLSIKHLARLPKLRRIGLVKCQNLTDESIIALARGPYGGTVANPLLKPGVSTQFVSLERVHLSYCTSLTLKGITELLLNCPRLTHLSLTGVQAFLRDDLTRFCREAPSEFTHTQRDVFCVFSGDGVKRLQEYLERLALEEAERDLQHNGAPDEPVVGPNSPDADSLSDGTIDGADPPYDFIFGPGRAGLPSRAQLPRTRPRPRSMHDLSNLSNFHVDMPLMAPGHAARGSSWTPNANAELDAQEYAELQRLDMLPRASTRSGRPRSRSPLMPPPLPELGPLTPRGQSRRHTVESADGFFGANAIAHSTRREASHDPEAEVFEQMHKHLTSLHSFELDLDPTPPPPPPPAPLAPMWDQQPGFNPDPRVSTFEVNEDAILATVPTLSRGVNHDQSRSDSPATQRVTSRSRMGNFFNNVRAVSSSPFSTSSVDAAGTRSSPWNFVGRAHRQSSRSRREYEEARQEMLRAARGHDAELLRTDNRQTPSAGERRGRDISVLPLLSQLPSSMLAQLSGQPDTPGTPTDFRSSPIPVPPRRISRAHAPVQGPEVVMADLASALPEVDRHTERRDDNGDIDMS